MEEANDEVIEPASILDDYIDMVNIKYCSVDRTSVGQDQIIFNDEEEVYMKYKLTKKGKTFILNEDTQCYGCNWKCKDSNCYGTLTSRRLDIDIPVDFNVLVVKNRNFGVYHSPTCSVTKESIIL